MTNNLASDPQFWNSSEAHLNVLLRSLADNSITANYQKNVHCKSTCLYTRNLAIANRSRVNCAHKVTTVSKSDLQTSLKVIGNFTVRYSAYAFLLPFHSNYGPILYHFPHIARCWSKIAKCIYSPSPPAFNASVGGDPVGISQRRLVL